MHSSIKKIARVVQSYAVITAGMVAYALAWVGIITPAKIMGGGVTGIALLIFYATGGEANGGIPIGYSYFALNAILLTCGSLILGWIFGVKTIYSMLVVTFVLTLGQEYLPPDMLGIANDKLLSAILGGIICGVGVSAAIVQGGSAGGTDIIAMIINKYRSISFGTIIIACDVIIVGASYFIYEDITTIVYGYITMIALGYSADVAIQGRKRTCQIMIISKHYAEISDAITAYGRGATILSAQGWYTKNEQKIVLVYCRISEAKEIHFIAKDIDESSFISTSSVSGVLGNGFEKLVEKPKPKAKMVKEQ